MEKKSDILVALLVIGLIAVSIILAVTNRIPSPAAPSTITATGQSQVTIEPDKVDVYLRIETVKPTATAARDDNAETANAVIAALTTGGIPRADIQTDQYSLYRKEEYNPKTQTVESEGYAVYHVLRVTSKDTSLASSIIDTGIGAGANGVDRITFGLTKQKELQVNAQAVQAAAGIAADKVASLAQNLKVTLGGIVSVSESNTNYIPFDYASNALAGEKAATNILPQNINVNGYVTVVYEISGR